MTTDASSSAAPGGVHDGHDGHDDGAPPPVASAAYVAPTVRLTTHRRRPSGAPPPLPRPIGITGKGWMIALVVLVLWLVVAWLSASARRATDRLDAAILRAFTDVRVGWLTDVFRAIDRVATGWTMFGLAAALIAAMVVFRRWRHLFTFLGSVLVLSVIGVALVNAFSRPRPYDVTTIGRWRGYSLPSTTATVVAFTAVGIVYTMVVAGRPRTIAKIVAGVAVGTFAIGRIYLGVDHPFDAVVGATLGVAIPLNAFRFFTPNEIFPVTYRRGKTAHLDVGGRRGEALRRAVEDQLGVIVVDVQPIGLHGSGGSTPLRLRVEGDPDTFLFGKLYAMNHVRADRWYKLGRTILYGRLEDEAPFQSVRRLVQYEDYALRVMRDAGVPTAAPIGIVELTPDREYLLVTEFFDGSVEIGDAEITDQIIDESLAMIRRLWRAGLAHRDIKPANLLVKDGHLIVIDVAFAQVRPSPWREAVDLANMMLVLAVRTDADRIYGRALRHFSPDEIAEAFAATRGIASPTQLRAAMKTDGRDLVTHFRVQAPDRPTVSLQLWGVRRVALALGLVAGVALALVGVYSMFTPVNLPVAGDPDCIADDAMILMAQAVPTATAVPCVASLPAGFDIDSVQIDRGRGRFWLGHDDAGSEAVEVILRAEGQCSIEGASEVPSDEVGMRRFEEPERLPPGLRATRTYLLPGACVTYRFEFDGNTNASLLPALDVALSFEPRADVIAEVQRRSGLRLCGAGVPTCPGGDG